MNEYMKVQTNEFIVLFSTLYCHSYTVPLALTLFKAVKMPGGNGPFNRLPIYLPLLKKRLHVIYKFRSGEG